MTGNVAITMAGFGRRFQEAGYIVPKYRIEALERPLFDWSMISLLAFRDAGWTFSFAVRAADAAEDFIRQRCLALEIDIGDLHLLDAPTDGQATTADILAQRVEDPDLPFLVFNIDTYVTPYVMAPSQIGVDDAGWVPCFPGPGSSWSFARVDDYGRVTEFREKERISDHATLGAYWFASANLYRKTYQTYFSIKNEEKGERYIAPMYNQLIAKGLRVSLAGVNISDVGMMGTPQQVQSFVSGPPTSTIKWAAC